GGAGVYGYAQPSLLAYDPDDPNLIVAGGRDSGVFLSTNKGADWHLLTDPFTSDTSGTPNLPRPWFAHFEHLSDTDVNIYIGTQGRGVWKIKIRLPKPGDNNTTVGVGIGASVAVGLVDDTTTASITGTLVGGADLTINASTQHLLNVSAKTAAADDQVAQQRGFADTTSTSNGGHGTGGTGTPSASTSDGGVSVAAAVGINLATTTSLATVADNVTIHAGGRFTLATSADTDAQAAA